MSFNRMPERGLVSVVAGIIFLACSFRLPAQTAANERVFPQSMAAVEKVLKSLQSRLAGRLPALEGFAQPGDHPLDLYERGYYQTTTQISSTASGGSLVRVATKVTAWYKDPIASHSGYQLLVSNGRLEADLLDQLADELARNSSANNAAAPSVSSPASSTQISKGTEPKIASTTPAPLPQTSKNIEPKISSAASGHPDPGSPFSASPRKSLEEEERASVHPPEMSTDDKAATALQAEANNLEEILKNQAHPKNLVAVKKSGTPVVDAPSLTARTQFLASMHDEFEMINFNENWVHVRISGLSRGWIWRNSVEMPEGIPDTEPTDANRPPTTDLFRTTREETAEFPGDWEPLRGKTVKILSIQKTDEAAKDAGPRERLNYATSLMAKNYAEIVDPKTPQAVPNVAGIVLIFDSSDGGMIAATLSTLQEWKAGKLTDAAFWHKCFFDPPETFDPEGSSPGK